MSLDFGFYGILTDPACGYEKLAEEMVRRKVRYIQLRMKEAPVEVICETAKSLRSIISGESLFILNDDPAMAREVGADGVHIGQEDMAYDEARRIMGPDRIVGLSTHNPDQAAAASALVPLPDYIGVGPVFATPTKKKPDPVIGLDTMRAMVHTAPMPAVAIGGIDLENLRDVIHMGARNVCAVRCVNQATNPGDVIERFQEALAAVASASVAG